ncbi:hypothetical protein PoB_001492600 [Plakobranchus ocellatus]|uniref:Uncharacterized protein n=1 Tax=Plakobranchus ocellatus TaxID=259542 RepID=A0AAV3Z1G5_9GAST|nr:hypothetical protein PoB_001492600 [Plakobranchus ocellatus]
MTTVIVIRDNSNIEVEDCYENNVDGNEKNDGNHDDDYDQDDEDDGDLRLSGPPSGQGTGGGARTRDRKVPAGFRADSLAPVPPTSP